MAKTRARQVRVQATKHPERHGAGIEDMLLQRNLPALTRSMTFSRMVKENSRFLIAIKDLRWLFPPVCQRKDQAVLTETERSRYICAFNTINNDGTLGSAGRHSRRNAH